MRPTNSTPYARLRDVVDTARSSLERSTPSCFTLDRISARHDLRSGCYLVSFNLEPGPGEPYAIPNLIPARSSERLGGSGVCPIHMDREPERFDPSLGRFELAVVVDHTTFEPTYRVRYLTEQTLQQGLAHLEQALSPYQRTHDDTVRDELVQALQRRPSRVQVSTGDPAHRYQFCDFYSDPQK